MLKHRASLEKGKSHGQGLKTHGSYLGSVFLLESMDWTGKAEHQDHRALTTVAMHGRHTSHNTNGNNFFKNHSEN